MSKMLNSKNIGFYSGIIAFMLILLFDFDPQNRLVTYTLAVAALMAIWWITQAIPISVTSLLPIVLFPLLGIMNGKDVSSIYFNHVIFLFIGGFLVALAMEKWNLHTRIALKVLLLVGNNPRNILFGFMFSAAFLSMWMSNTATCMMMIPIVLSVIRGIENEGMKKFQIALLLGIAYASSIGGIATLVGTPPNLSFVRIYSIIFPQAPDITFFNWLIFAFPLTVLIFIFVFLWLYYRYNPREKWNSINKDFIKNQYKALGKVSFEEKVVLIVFIAMAILWVTYSGIEIGQTKIPGWNQWFPRPEYINDGTIAILMALVLFIIPSNSRKGENILQGDVIMKVPWNIVLLFGGGFALATGFTQSGLSNWFGEQMSWAGQFHPLLVIFIITLFINFLTELTSNTATVEMILPIVAALAVSIKVNPLLFMLPATLAASMAFMLPVATPPNAIVFATNELQIKDMIKTGFVINMISVVLITVWVYLFAGQVFDFNIGEFPMWAAHTAAPVK